MLDNTPNQPTTFRKKKRVEINDDACGTYNKNSEIKFKTSMLDNAKYVDVVMPMNNLREYSDHYSKTTGSLWQYTRFFL